MSRSLNGDWKRSWNETCIDAIVMHFQKEPENLVSYIENAVNQKHQVVAIHLFQLFVRLGVDLSPRSEGVLKEGLTDLVDHKKYFVDPAAFPEIQALLYKGRLTFPKPKSISSRPSRYSLELPMANLRYNF